MRGLVDGAGDGAEGGGTSINTRTGRGIRSTRTCGEAGIGALDVEGVEVEGMGEDVGITRRRRTTRRRGITTILAGRRLRSSMGVEVEGMVHLRLRRWRCMAAAGTMEGAAGMAMEGAHTEATAGRGPPEEHREGVGDMAVDVAHMAEAEDMADMDRDTTLPLVGTVRHLPIPDMEDHPLGEAMAVTDSPLQILNSTEVAEHTTITVAVVVDGSIICRTIHLCTFVPRITSNSHLNLYCFFASFARLFSPSAFRILVTSFPISFLILL